MVDNKIKFAFIAFCMVGGACANPSRVGAQVMKSPLAKRVMSRFMGIPQERVDAMTAKERAERLSSEMEHIDGIGIGALSLRGMTIGDMRLPYDTENILHGILEGQANIEQKVEMLLSRIPKHRRSVRDLLINNAGPDRMFQYHFNDLIKYHMLSDEGLRIIIAESLSKGELIDPTPVLERLPDSGSSMVTALQDIQNYIKDGRLTFSAQLEWMQERLEGGPEKFSQTDI